MVQATFLENLKRLRLAKGFTQEQVADRLKVNMQTVSRWECGTSLPDVLTLPALARLYGVTVDDFYKKSSVAYENYAQRLAAVYEKTRDPEDFIRCLAEFRKCINEGKLTIGDQWNYAIIHQFMFQYCMETAIAWYDALVNDDPSEDPHAYWRARSCRVSMYCAAGRCEEILIEQKERVLTDPDDVRESDLLIQAYIFADRYDEAYEFFHETAEKFPDDWQIYIHGGDICKKMKSTGMLRSIMAEQAKLVLISVMTFTAKQVYMRIWATMRRPATPTCRLQAHLDKGVSMWKPKWPRTVQRRQWSIIPFCRGKKRR